MNIYSNITEYFHSSQIRNKNSLTLISYVKNCPKNTSEIPPKKLIYIKGLIEHALEHSETILPIDIMIAVHNAHMACEWLFRLILNDWNSNFIKLVKKIEEKFSEIETYKGDLLELNRLRSTIQHKSIPVDKATAKKLCEKAREAIALLFNIAYGTEYDEVSFAYEIINTKIKQLINKAEKEYTKGRYAECIETCWEVLDEVIGEFAKIAGLATGVFAPGKINEIIDEKYKERYFTAECRQLAEDLSSSIRLLGYASTTMQFLTIDEKIEFIKVMQTLNSYFAGKLKKELLDIAAKEILYFSAKIAYKLDRIKSKYGII